MKTMNVSDKVLVADTRRAIEKVAELMNEAKSRNIIVSFSIPEVILEDVGPRFQPVIDIKRVESL